MNIIAIIPARGGSKEIPKKIYLTFVENHLFPGLLRKYYEVD